MHLPRPLIVATLLLLLPLLISAATIHVPSQEPTIQAGLGAASAGDTVLISCGTYYEHDLTMSSGVTLLGETGEAESVIIDAEYLARVFYLVGVGGGASIEGLTIRHGFSGYAPGGAMYCEACSLQITDVRFEDNSAYDNGGALYCFESELWLSDVVFEGNTAHMGGSGGAIYADWSPAELSGAVFTENTCEADGGAVYLTNSPGPINDVTFSGNTAGSEGGGLYCYRCSPHVTDVVFELNHADRDGGGMFCYYYAKPVLTDVLFAENSASRHAGGLHMKTYANGSLTNVTFWRNTAVEYGGGMVLMSWTHPPLTSCTFADNSAGMNGGGLFCINESSPALNRVIIAFSSSGEGIYGMDDSNPTLACCDVWGNAGGGYGGTVPDQTGIVGNIAEDPLFCGMPSGDLTIDAASPCAPENSDCEMLMGAHGIGCGGVAVEKKSWGAIKGMYR